MALVYYHRGHKLRPELQEFRLGIQKAQEAIDNSVGCKYPAFHKGLSVKLLRQLQVKRRKSDWSICRSLAVFSSPFNLPAGSKAKGNFPSIRRKGEFKNLPVISSLNNQMY